MNNISSNVLAIKWWKKENLTCFDSPSILIVLRRSISITDRIPISVLLLVCPYSFCGPLTPIFCSVSTGLFALEDCHLQLVYFDCYDLLPLKDGHYWFESSSVDQVQPLENTPRSNLHFKPPSRIRFSSQPVKQFSTHAVEVRRMDEGKIWLLRR